MRKRLLALFSVLIVGALLLSACGGETVVETVHRRERRRDNY